MSSQVYFSGDDPLGNNSNVCLLYRHHFINKNRQNRQQTWEHNKNTNIFPQGKSYWKMLTLQFKNEVFK